MAGIEERVKGFWDSWPIVKEQLEEVLKEIGKDERLFYGHRTCGSLWGESEDDLSETVGEGDTGV
jgi:hypothetical protein